MSHLFSAADSLAVFFLLKSGKMVQVAASEAIALVSQATGSSPVGSVPGEDAFTMGRRLAQQVLKDYAATRDAAAKSAAGLALLLVASVSA